MSSRRFNYKGPFTSGGDLLFNIISLLGNTTDRIDNYSNILSKFSLRNSEFPDEDLCYLVPGTQATVADCHFKTDAQTFLVIHGWSVSYVHTAGLQGQQDTYYI